MSNNQKKGHKVSDPVVREMFYTTWLVVTMAASAVVGLIAFFLTRNVGFEDGLDTVLGLILGCAVVGGTISFIGLMAERIRWKVVQAFLALFYIIAVVAVVFSST